MERLLQKAALSDDLEGIPEGDSKNTPDNCEATLLVFGSHA